MKVNLSRIDKSEQWKFNIPHEDSYLFEIRVVEGHEEKYPLTKITEVFKKKYSLVILKKSDSNETTQNHILSIRVNWSKNDAFKLSISNNSDFSVFRCPYRSTSFKDEFSEQLNDEGFIKGQDSLKLKIEDFAILVKFNTYTEAQDVEIIKKQRISYREFIQNCITNEVIVKNIKFKKFENITETNNTALYDCDKSNFSKGIFQNIIFKDISLKEAIFHESQFQDVSFVNTDLERSDFEESTFVSCKFLDCKLENTIFRKSSFRPSSEFSKNRKQSKYCRIGLSKNHTSKISIKECIFNEVDSQFLVLNNIKIENTSFKDSSLTYTDLSGSEISDCKFDRASMQQTKLVEVCAKGCSFIGTSLISSSFIQGDFQNCDMTGVDLRYSDLTLLKLRMCFLSGSKFYQTNRGGLKIDFEKSISENNNHTTKENNPNNYISFIDWTPDGNCEFQIDLEDFQYILSGKKSPIYIIQEKAGNASKIYIDASNRAQISSDNKTNSTNITNGTTNVNGDINNSKLEASKIENCKQESEK